VISSSVEWIRQKWDAYSQKPFSRLVRLFVGRIFYGGEDAGDGELGLGMGLALSLLALPGGFYSIFLLEKYSTLLQWMRGQHEFDPLAGALPDEYFFIVLSMVVTGVVAVWRWDSIFPDRRDYANLVSLPISIRTIFLANLAAIVFTTLVLALDVNAASAVLFPLVVSASADTFSFFAHFIGVHAFVVVLASIFSFFAVFVSVGLLMVTLPYAVFRRISLYFRGIVIACLVATLSTSFAVPSMLSQLPETPVRFLPPVWFLGLCQLIRGRASASLAALGWVALAASGCIIVAAVTIYVFSYRRCFVRIPETTNIGPAANREHISWMFPALDRTILTSPFQRAGYRFVMKTLLRSEHHGLVLGGFFGLGIVIASQFLFASFNGQTIGASGSPSSEVLAIPLILGYCITLGVRFAFDIPTEIRANWVFQLCVDRVRHECIPLARKVMLSFILPWVVAIALPLYGYLWGWRVGLVQMIIVPIWSLLLAETLLLRFRKIPFTCSYPPFRDSAVVLVLFYVLGFFVFVVLTSNLEHWALLKPVLMVSFIIIAVVAGYALSRLRREIGEIDKELIFEEKAPVAFELLDLRRGS
jgi:hypothetical protein